MDDPDQGTIQPTIRLGRDAMDDPDQHPTGRARLACGPFLVAACLAAGGLAGCQVGMPAVPRATVPLPPALSATTASPTVSDFLDAGDLTGRIIVVSISEAGAGNVIRAVDPRTGQSTDLWTLGEITTLGDWRPSADGRRMLYRLSSASHTAWDRLFLQDLSVGAEPLTLASSEKMWQAHFAGALWSPDGSSVAFGWETGTPAQSDRTVEEPHAWQVRVLEVSSAGPALAGTVGEARAIWSSDEDPRQVPLALAGWDQAAGRLALLELAPDGGHAAGVRVVDVASGGRTAGQTVSAVPSDAAASPNGHWLAIADTLPPRLLAIELDSGRTAPVAPSARGWQPDSPVWSPDGQWLAWTERPGAGAGGMTDRVRIRVRRIGQLDAPSADDLAVAIDGTSSEAVAFDPTSRLLLVAGAEPYTVEPSRLIAYRLADGAALPFSWRPPAGTWRIDWLPSPPEPD